MEYGIKKHNSAYLHSLIISLTIFFSFRSGPCRSNHLKWHFVELYNRSTRSVSRENEDCFSPFLIISPGPLFEVMQLF